MYTAVSALCCLGSPRTGKGRGSEQMQLTLADGFSLTLLPDRCLDVAEASFRGIPLASLTPPRVVAPAFADETSPTGESARNLIFSFEEHIGSSLNLSLIGELTSESKLVGAGFVRNFQAGLVYTCGLTAIGKPVPGPDEPGGEEDGPVPTHGRVSTIPAEQLSATAGWEDGKYVLRASGVVREVSAFGTNLQLTRRITAVLGEASFRIDDEVENLSSSRASPLMFCYHCNP